MIFYHAAPLSEVKELKSSFLLLCELIDPEYSICNCYITNAFFGVQDQSCSLSELNNTLHFICLTEKSLTFHLNDHLIGLACFT